MKKSTRSQQSKETKKIIATAKKMLDDGVSFKEVTCYIRNQYDLLAEQNFGFFDNIQYEKAIKSVVEYL